MARVTIMQLHQLAKIAQMLDFEQARAAFAETGITPKTTFHTKEEKLTALRARAAMYNPDDCGKYGKLNEIEKRVNASKCPMPWASFKARNPLLNDQLIKVNGVSYALEHKTGAGDWYRTHCETLDKAMAEYSKRIKLLVWDTDEFTLVIPFSKLLESLDGYKGRGTAQGWQTFFKSHLQLSEDGCTYVVQLQNWKTSKLKIAFLQQLARDNMEWYELVKDVIFQ